MKLSIELSQNGIAYDKYNLELFILFLYKMYFTFSRISCIRWSENSVIEQPLT